jgi:hypothetical protein
MALLTLFMLLFPESVLDSLWRLNPEAHVGLQSLGRWAIALMAIVATACGLSAVGLAKLAPWGRILALAVLAVNLIGAVGGALIRRDPRTLIGVPIGGAVILYLISTGVRRIFAAGTSEQFGRMP